MENKKEELIIVKQLPIIEEKLKGLSKEIDDKVKNALALVCSDETVKEVKKVRADLNADFKELEAQRKMVKEKVLAPYQAFEEVYKTYVSDKFINADTELKMKIQEVEQEQKNKKTVELLEYYVEYSKSQNLDWLFEDKDYFDYSNINVTLSASMKSLKEQVKAFVDKIVDDMQLMATQEHRQEIFVEYKKTLNVSKAITEVSDRYKQLEVIKQEQVKQEEIKKQEEETIKKVDEVIKPVEEQKVYELHFKVIGTKEQLLKLKQYLDSEGLKYE